MPVIVAQLPPTAQANYLPTVVKVDPSCGKPSDLLQIQQTANVVAAQVDALIPGRPKDYPADGILIFGNLPEFEKAIHHDGPITLFGGKLPGEPTTTQANTLRIAVTVLDQLYLQRFVYQLSHELAHVKMGVRVDNSLIETFATAVSLEVLRRMGIQRYLIPATLKQIQALPMETQKQIADGTFDALKLVWQENYATDWKDMDKRHYQTLGAILLQVEGQYFWPLLLNVSELAIGEASAENKIILLPPNIKAMYAKGINLSALGYPSL